MLHELPAEFLAFERQLHGGLQPVELVADVVAPALELEGQDPFLFQQERERVRELYLAVLPRAGPPDAADP